MDYQVLFNVAITLAAFLGGWILQSISGAIRRLDDHVQSIPLRYVNRDDYKSDINEIKQICTRIFDKLDEKMDK